MAAADVGVDVQVRGIDSPKLYVHSVICAKAFCSVALRTDE